MSLSQIRDPSTAEWRLCWSGDGNTDWKHSRQIPKEGKEVCKWIRVGVSIKTGFYQIHHLCKDGGVKINCSFSTPFFILDLKMKLWTDARRCGGQAPFVHILPLPPLGYFCLPKSWVIYFLLFLEKCLLPVLSVPTKISVSCVWDRMRAARLPTARSGRQIVFENPNENVEFSTVGAPCFYRGVGFLTWMYRVLRLLWLAPSCDVMHINGTHLDR